MLELELFVLSSELVIHPPSCQLGTLAFIFKTMATQKALVFEVAAKCSVSNARAARLKLVHQTVDLPVFMPVGTQGTLKGVTSSQLENLQCQIMLANTYHLGLRPVLGCHIFLLCFRVKSYLRKLGVNINLWDGTMHY